MIESTKSMPVLPIGSHELENGILAYLCSISIIYLEFPCRFIDAFEFKKLLNILDY
jgi:hypothetical protein